MKIINVIVMSAILFFSAGFASAVSFTDMADITTGDSTPTIEFTVTGNNTSYVCNLLINGTLSGVGTISNNTLSSITCNRTLERGSYTYNITAYNATEDPTLTYSSDYTITYNTFGSIVELIGDVIPAMKALKDIVVVAGTILILLVVVIGLRDMFGDFIAGFGVLFKKK